MPSRLSSDRWRLALMAAILVAAVLATGRARAQDIHEPPAAASETGGSGEGGAVANGPAYSVRIVGDIDDKLRALLEESSQLRSLRDRPPASPAALRRRIADDVARFAPRWWRNASSPTIRSMR